MSEACLNQTIPMDRSVPGTEAYWAAQREAFALIEAWQTTDPDDPWAELAALRRIAAHPSAAGVMHAHGRGVAIDATGTVAEHCCHCRARTYQDRDGICQLCGCDGEAFEPVAPAGGPGIGHGAGQAPCCQAASGEQALAQP